LEKIEILLIYFMRILSSLTIVLFFSFQSFAQDSLSVLFIGNSYVYTFDLPTVLKNLAESKGDILAVASKTNGGYTFQNHVNDPVTYNKIHITDWNYVVLQGQSQEPSFPYTQVNSTTLPFALQLADSVYANSPCSQVQYFMTWGRQNGDPQWDSINTFDKMNGRLRDAYLRIAENANASVAAAGPAWKYVRDNHPTINLFSSDGSHPSFAGTYLNACVFYSSLYHKSPVGANYIGSLDLATAQILQDVARLTVLDSMQTWKLTHPDSLTFVSFNFSQIGGSLTYEFNSNAENVNDYFWNFGDGANSTLQNPSHTFQSNGTYTIELIGSGPCGADTISKEITINIAGINELSNGITIQTIDKNNFLIKGKLNTKETNVFDLTGRTVPFQLQEIGNDELILTTTASGILFLNSKSLNGEFTLKFPLFAD
jgi:hypothetical protein